MRQSGCKLDYARYNDVKTKAKPHRSDLIGRCAIVCKGVRIVMHVSSAFVCLMGMGVTFAGLTCIIFLTMLMGKILGSSSRLKPIEETPAPAPASDGLTDEVRIAILAAIAQEPGFNMANVTCVSIRKI